PIRHLDHIQPASQNGPTTLANGQGLCVTCNETKDAKGWISAVVPGPRHTICITTPNQHTFHTTAPPPPR
ncbi:MAG: HNH endonuclease, partial [Promicromonosporaceae bacterium]|nr:HNH endonuclease [Promicromonosporaceae bacterium]